MVAMLVFPRDRQGQTTLAGEVLQCFEEGRFELLLSRVILDELEEVIERDFPEQYREFVALSASFEDHLTRWPTPGEIQKVLPVVVDTDDAPVVLLPYLLNPTLSSRMISRPFTRRKRRHSGESIRFR